MISHVLITHAQLFGPLHVAPQMAQVKMTFFLPALPSSRLPQSLQKMREPMADMAAGCPCAAGERTVLRRVVRKK
jgi:hypothetical protein